MFLVWKSQQSKMTTTMQSYKGVKHPGYYWNHPATREGGLFVCLSSTRILALNGINIFEDGHNQLDVTGGQQRWVPTSKHQRGFYCWSKSPQFQHFFLPPPLAPYFQSKPLLVIATTTGMRTLISHQYFHQSKGGLARLTPRAETLPLDILMLPCSISRNETV